MTNTLLALQDSFQVRLKDPIVRDSAIQRFEISAAGGRESCAMMAAL
jgi:hypothetical protein